MIINFSVKKVSFKLLSFILIYFFGSQISAQEIGKPIIRNYTQKEYDNAPVVFSALQDENDIMYFGVQNGVMQFDGVTWRNIPFGKETYTYDLAMDANGKIYVAAINEFGYLDTNTNGNIVYITLTHLKTDSTLSVGTVWSVKLTNKQVYFLTLSAIYQYTPAENEIQIFKADSNSIFIGDFVYDDTYFVRSKNQGLMRIENNEIKTTYQPDFFKNTSFNSCLSYNDSTVLITSRIKGLYLFQPDMDAMPKALPIVNNDFVADNDIYKSAKLLDKYYALGSFKKGALLIDKKGRALQQFNTSNQLL